MNFDTIYRIKDSSYTSCIDFKTADELMHKNIKLFRVYFRKRMLKKDILRKESNKVPKIYLNYLANKDIDDIQTLNLCDYISKNYRFRRIVSFENIDNLIRHYKR